MSRQNQMEQITNGLGVIQLGRNLSGGSLLSAQRDAKIQQERNKRLDEEKPTTAGTVGQDISDPQNSASPAPDIADQARVVQGYNGTEFGPRDENYGKGPSGINWMKSKLLDEARGEASNDSPSEDSQLMGMPKAEADAIEAGGSVETVIDGDSMTTVIKPRPEDTTPPASRTQQPDFVERNGFNEHQAAVVAGSQYEEDGERANTNPSEVDKAQQFLKERVGRIKFPAERRNLPGTEENPGNEDISDAPTLPSPVDGKPVLDLRDYYTVEGTGDEPLDLEAIRARSIPQI